MAALTNLGKFTATSKLKQATFAFIASQLITKQEKENIDKVFRAMDTNGDGKLDKKEIQNGYLEFFGKSMSDEEVVRAMKSILNKLTIERFDSLCGQLLNCGIRTALHLELLIHEIFEKATTQHHFIDMYADLCVLLNDNGIIDDPKVKIKKILLTCCQASFEKHLTPPSDIAELNGEDRSVAESLYKTRMLGNIRFVGSLLVRKMLASKVMFSIAEELLQEPTPEALESLAAFLIVVGPGFDFPDWSHIATFNGVFKQVEKLSKKASIPKRIRCLLKDVLELRNAGWNDKRPKKIEGPLKLEQVAAKAALENGGDSPAMKTNNADGEWAVVGGARSGKVFSPLSNKPTSLSFLIPSSPKPVKDVGSGQAVLMSTNCAEKLESPKRDSVQEPRASVNFDKDLCRAEISATLKELRISHDVSEAIVRIGNIGIPASHQASELNDIMAHLSEEGSQEARKIGLSVVAGLFLEKHWKPESATQGIRRFVEETCEDLKCDVPALAKIVCDEVHPAFSPLVEGKVLDPRLHAALLNV